ncbi:hypothetical protein FS837_005730 [Tulasnella sp. UAMH 9824]|nr:hypothetical protein FS837_005730 [Tulasnella sp. UAMH 9824]
MTLPWGNWDKMQDTKWPNILAVMVFGVSWAFLFAGNVLVTGAGLALNDTTCAMAIYSCIILYAFSKILIYAFLIEKVWLVWRTDYKTGFQARWNNLIWRTGMIGLSFYIVILTLMLVGKQTEIRTRDGACIIGLSRFSSIPLLTFDLFITLALTSLFVRPLWRGKFPTIRLRNLAIKTVISSGVALGTSAVNIAVLTILHGKELGWVCLTSCGGDVAINAIVLYIVTSGSQIQEASNGTENKPTPTPLEPINDRRHLMNNLRKHGLANDPLSPSQSLKAGRSASISSATGSPVAPSLHVHFKGSDYSVEGGGVGDSPSPASRFVSRLPNRPRLGSFSTTDSESKSPAMSTPALSGLDPFNPTDCGSESQTHLNSSVAGGQRPAKNVRSSLSATVSSASTGARSIFRSIGEVLWGSRAQPEATNVQVTVTMEEDVVLGEKFEVDPTKTRTSTNGFKEKDDDTETDSRE